MSDNILYGHATSSSSFRVRIALNWKAVQYSEKSITVKERSSPEYQKQNPQQLIPLVIFGNVAIAQSMSILEYAEEVFDGKELLPKSAEGRARVRGLAQYIVSEIQPLQNTRLDKYLDLLGVEKMSWKQHWIKDGLHHLETELSNSNGQTGEFCHGDLLTMADCCLVPQVYNATVRYGVSLENYPTIKRIYENSKQVEEVQRAWPEEQPEFDG